MDTKLLYIDTIGCQMNVYDSEQFAKGLRPMGYTLTSSLDTANLVIVNTCSIREKAQQKAFSFLGRLATLKRKKPDLIIGVGGCVAQQEGSRILERMPHLDFVFGTYAVGRLPKIVKEIELKRRSFVDIDNSGGMDGLEPIAVVPSAEDNQSPTRFVTIMRGCDNHCTYCVVPHVRGREVSRNPANILREIRNLVKSGVREITLLGQNVNSFGKKEGSCSFPELLFQIHDIEDILRIRFTTSHPKDLSRNLIDAFSGLNKLCKHIHLPVQSGSNLILRRMNRKYTREEYLEKVDRLHSICPDIAISTDIILGFPGETPEDFDKTLDLIKKVEYDNLFAFKYSDRPYALATGYPGKVSELVKKERLEAVLDLGKEYAAKKNRSLIGSTELILVEGFSKKQRKSVADRKINGRQWSGRTSTNKIVNFTKGRGFYSNDVISKGQMIRVQIDKASVHSLSGTVVEGREKVSVPTKQRVFPPEFVEA
ncbi:MAG: tRNA (N6-isopentenyl adenosine(37)-C2)-methylthiotransferase MiaB [Desulfobacterales bacterium]|nr:tRNA (N6-isopentenyl adenosine(37)-C2)-methylthiotransferase MiaB [Desulfobacterales bacterium]